MRICKICKKAFVPKSGRALCCGPDCMKENGKLHAAAQYKRQLEGQSKTEYMNSFDRACVRFWNKPRLDNGRPRPVPKKWVSRQHIDVDVFAYIKGMEL